MTKEENTLRCRLYREKNRELIRSIKKSYYVRVQKEKDRIKRMGEKHCRICEILLKSTYGAYGTRKYCKRCVKEGRARKDSNRRSCKKYRGKIKRRIKIRLDIQKVV